MKTKQEIERSLANIEELTSSYTGMTYKDGLEEALLWVLGEISDEEFSPICDA